jgi:hypothetical protein
MHIEPGVLSASKLRYANVTAASTLAAHLPSLSRGSAESIVLAGVFPSLFTLALA